MDAKCNIATEYKLFYRPPDSPCSSALPDPSPPAVPPANTCFKPYTVGITPSDLAMTTTTNGMTVPYIVRVERGTINRGIYDIAVLFDPTSARLDGTLAAAGVEPQGGLHVRRFDRPAAAAIPQRAELGR